MCGGDKLKPPDEATIGLFSRLSQPHKLLCHHQQKPIRHVSPKSQRL